MAKQSIRKKKQKLVSTSLQGNFPHTIIFTLDLQYRYTDFSQAHATTMKKIWGVDIQVGMDMLELILSRADRTKARKNFDRALTGKYFKRVEQYGDPNHYRTYYENHYGPVKNTGGKIIGLSVLVVDVTPHIQGLKALRQQMALEQSLQELSERYQLVVSSFGRVVYDYDVKSGAIRWSGKCDDVLGFSAQELGDISTWENNIHPDDRNAALNLLTQAQHRVSRYQTQYRFRTKAGHYIWLQDVGFFLPDKHGVAMRMVGEMTNISQQIESDREIRHLASFPMHNPEVVFEINRDGSFSYGNPAYYEAVRRLGVKDHTAFLNHEADTNKMEGVAWKSTTDITINNRTYSEKIFYLPEKDLLRIYAFDLTDRIEAERQRSDLELTYKALFESDTDSIMLLDIDGDPGRILSANPATAAMYGYSMAELLKLRIQDIDVVEPGIHLTYRERVLNLIENKRQTFEVVHRRKDGSVFPLEVVGAVIEISGKRVNMAIMRDISARKKAEEALRESEQRFRALHEASFGGIAIHDMGQIVECNSGLSRLTGYLYEELIGFNGLNLIHPDDRAMVLENIKAQIEHPYDARGIRKDGSVYAIEIKGKAVPYRGKLMRVTEFRDITERVQAAESIKEQNARLQAIAENLKFKNEQLDEFTQIVSHNLRAPAGNIVSLSAFLAQEQDQQEQAKILELLKQSGANILTTLSELNEVLKIKQSKNVEKQLLRFTDLYEKACLILNAQITASKATLMADFSEADEIEYPHIYLESIFLNLMSNALKYHDTIRPLKLSLKTMWLDGRICLEVADTGLGINLERYGHQIFKMRKTFHHHPDSRGIGLFMIKNQVEAMGGAITVISQEGVGSTFRVVF
jgi:PAS domain S-box-containing protein